MEISNAKFSSGLFASLPKSQSADAKRGNWINGKKQFVSRCSLEDDLEIEDSGVVTEFKITPTNSPRTLYRTICLDNAIPPKIMDEAGLYATKLREIFTIMTKSKRICIFWGENHCMFSSSLLQKEKMGKYGFWFESYIVVKPSKKKTESNVHIELLEKIKYCEPSQKFQKIALMGLLNSGIFTSVITSSQSGDFPGSEGLGKKFIQLYGKYNNCQKQNKSTVESDIVQEGKPIDDKKTRSVFSAVDESDLTILLDVNLQDE
jgi:hypothetical protein